MAEKSLVNQNISVSKPLTGPSPFNTLLWRVIGISDSVYVEGIYSLLDKSDEIKFNFHSSENELLNTISDNWNVKRLQWFTKGFYKVSNIDSKIVMTDIRMGISQNYFFDFVVGKTNTNGINITRVEKLEPEDFDSTEPLLRLWQRIWNENIKLL